MGTSAFGATAQFDVDAGAPPYTRNYALLAENDIAEVLLTVAGFEAGDVIQQVSFTAKVSPSDADGAPTTVQHIWQPPNGTTGPQVTALDTAGTVYQILIPLSAADTLILATLHSYDIRLWVLRGVTLVRTILSGQIITYLGNTSIAGLVGGGFTQEDGGVFVQEGY